MSDNIKTLTQMLSEVVKAQESQKKKPENYTHAEVSEAFKEIFNTHSFHDAVDIIADISYESIQEGFSADIDEGLIIPPDPQGIRELGDLPSYYRRNRPKCYWMESTREGMQLRSQKLQKEMFSPNMAEIHCLIDSNVDELKKGEYGTLSEQVQDAKEEMSGAVFGLQFRSVVASIGTGNTGWSNYTAASGGLTKAALDAMVNYLDDNGGGKAIVGLTTEFHNLEDLFYSTSAGSYGLLSDSMKDRIIMSGGSFSMYKGVPIVKVRQKSLTVGPGLIASNRFKANFDTGRDSWGMLPSGNVVGITSKIFGRFIEQGPLAVVKETSAYNRQVAISFGRRIGLVAWDPHLNYRVNTA